MPRIACYPAKSSMKIGYTFSPEYYDVTEIVNFDEGQGEGIGDLCCLENWGDPLLWAETRNDLDNMENLYSKFVPGSKPIHLSYEGAGPYGNICTMMVPPDFEHGDPIFFNTDTKTIEFE